MMNERLSVSTCVVGFVGCGGWYLFFYVVVCEVRGEGR